MKTRQTIGFIMIELVFAVTIIAILATIAIPNFLESQVRASVSRARSDIRRAAIGLESYAIDNLEYPPVRYALVSGNRPVYDFMGADGSITRRFNHNTLPIELTTPIAYISTLFTDPFKDVNAERINATNGVVTAGPNTNPPLVLPDDLTTRDFIYNNIQQYVDFGGSLGFDDRDIDVYGQWRLVSIGPDNKFFGSIGRRAYDPTNGTFSLGDIISTQRSSEGAGTESASGSN